MNPNDPRLGRRPMADPRHGYSPGPWISLTVGAVVPSPSGASSDGSEV